jgi:outer membrane protein assembly factor BamB
MIAQLCLAALVGISCSDPPRGPSQETEAGARKPAAPAWPGWRGPLATGEAPGATPPTVWSEEHNVRWKTELPGHGLSSPVVWGEHLFLTTAIPVGDRLEPRPETAPGAHDNVTVTRRHQFVALCVRRADGKIVWQRTLKEELPHEGGHDSGSYASASPVVDGSHVFAWFGSRGLFCLDHDGDVLWQADLGDMQSKHGHGEGASPALHGDVLVVNWDHEGQSFVVAFDKATGEERWRKERDEATSWATPIVAQVDGKPQLIVSATERIRGYDLETGAEIWNCAGLSHNVVASPVYADGVLYAASSYEKQAFIALNLSGARGDLSTSDRVLWYQRRNTPYVPSPLLYRGSLYFLNHYQGVLSRIVAATGERPQRPMRLARVENVYASPVAAAGRIYVTDMDGTTAVLAAGPDPKVLAVNQLDDSFSASAALVGGDLYLRGDRFLYCVAEED